MTDAPLVLLVEDDAAIRGAFTLLLRECGYRVDSAATGGEALSLAAAVRPDVVVLDLGLPDANGVDVARALCAGPRPMPIVALTGRAFDDDRDAALQAGCSLYLVKPVATRDLLGAIETLSKS
ncbi:MAG: two component transcriptional regulator, winged helix family [Gemmatimonadetes bacterium]|nr:two component transcriptional regulator, winged helix family [Gemmatimonadota bacterium]